MSERSVIDVMAEFLAGHPPLPRRELHVAEPVWRFLRDRYASAVRPEAAARMLDLPVVIDGDLTGGQWQIREDGEVTSSGDMAPAPEGMAVHYAGHAGWIAVRADLTAAS